MSSRMEAINNFVKAYRTLSEIPMINSAQVISRNPSPDLIKVKSIWSQRNIELGETIKFQKNYVVNALSSIVVFESTPTDISSQEFSKTSPSEKYRCVIRKSKLDNKKKQFVEIWTQEGLFKNFDVSAFDVHGEIYCDGEFGTLEWSPDEEKVLYIAEKKPKKSEPFYKQRSDNEKDEDGKAPVAGDEYLYKPDWGEQLVDKHQPVLGVCNIKSESLTVLNGVPEKFSPGQLLWSMDGSEIFGMVLENEPRRLGLIYCTSRPGYIFRMGSNGKDFKIISDLHLSVRSPRLSPDGKTLFWLQRPAGGVHNGCQQLVKFDLAKNTKEMLIDIVRDVGKTFSGLYLHSLPTRCFSKDGTKLFFTSYNKLRSSSYYLDVGTKEIHLLETGEGSATILDVHDDIIIISAGTLQQAPSIKLSKSVSKIEWIFVTKPQIVCKNSVLKEMELESKFGNPKFGEWVRDGEPNHVKTVVTTGDQTNAYYNALYYGPPAPTASDQKVPLVVYPHGGPHSISVNDYSFEPNFFVKIGYGVLMVNYRGSLGAGQSGVEFLQGKVSDTDVKDNVEAVLHVLKELPYLDQKNVFLYGRSHGGYLVEHLSAQYSDFYRAVVAGNPVTDISAMYIGSDIPDWATSECGLPFDESYPLTENHLKKMIEASPIQLSDKIKAPTLFLLGKKDLRVPCFGAIKMYHALKAKKVAKVRLNLYDDNHTLGNVPNHMDCLINTALWFFENKYC